MMVLLKDYFKKKYNVLFDSDCSKKPVQRIRFTLAHELGHYVLRHFYDKSTNNFREIVRMMVKILNSSMKLIDLLENF